MPLVVKPVTPVVAEAVQAKVVPLTFEVRVTSVVLPPEQMVCDNGVLVTVGVGFNVTVTVNVLPVQLPAVGVTV